jgi:hypothetical protein
MNEYERLALYKRKMEFYKQQLDELHGGVVRPLDIDKITDLLVRGIPITSNEGYPNYGDQRQVVINEWKDYFTLVPDRIWPDNIRPTPLMIDSINVLNSNNQSILYCAYRFLSKRIQLLGDFQSSIKVLFNIPGIRFDIQNGINRHGEVDVPLSGFVSEHPNLGFILEEISKFNERCPRNTLNGSNVFKLLDDRTNYRTGNNFT